MEQYEFRDTTHFMVGAEGKPGQRLFFLQLGDYATRLNLKLEKQQAIALSGFLESSLEDMPADEFTREPAFLEPFAEPDWTIGEISVGVDVPNQMMVVSIAEALFDEDSVPSTVQIFINQTQAQTFIADIEKLVAKSRPPCKLCGQPADADGHQCPRLN